jgi:transporter family-2 protein
MLGVIYAIIAGFFVTIQSVFNTRLGEKIGSLETTLIVHVVGLMTAIIAVYLVGDGNLKRIDEVNKLYLLGGAFGVIIIYSAVKSFSLLGPTYAISVLLVSQLLVGLAIDTLGLFGTDKIQLAISKPIGILIMLAGILVFQMK